MTSGPVAGADQAATTRTDRGREARRTRVIESAMRLALTGGYDAVQMRAVAERADVAIGTIYRYFSGKDDLLIAGLVEWVALVRRRLENETPPEGPPVERLSWVLARTAQSTDSAPVLMGALITAMATTDPAAAEYKLAVEREVRGLVVWAIGDRPDVEGVARVLGHVWYSAIIRWVGGLAPDGSVSEELEVAARLLLASRGDASVDLR